MAGPPDGNEGERLADREAVVLLGHLGLSALHLPRAPTMTVLGEVAVDDSGHTSNSWLKEKRAATAPMREAANAQRVGSLQTGEDVVGFAQVGHRHGTRLSVHPPGLDDSPVSSTT